MIVSLEEVKEYLRVDGTEDDNLISLMMSVAQEKVEEFGESALQKEKAKLLFLVLVTDMYENRTFGISKEVEESIRGIKTELMYGSGADESGEIEASD